MRLEEDREHERIAGRVPGPFHMGRDVGEIEQRLPGRVHGDALLDLALLAPAWPPARDSTPALGVQSDQVDVRLARERVASQGEGRAEEHLSPRPAHVENPRPAQETGRDRWE